MLMAYKDGQDILTMSLGDTSGWTESTISVVASRIAGLGKIVTSAAGNDVSSKRLNTIHRSQISSLTTKFKGESGAWYSAAPSSGVNVISVASVDK